MIDEIKTLYKSMKRGKYAFLDKVATEFGIQPTSVKNNWFGTFWTIPPPHQAKVLEMLKEEIELQKATV